jgi:DNA-binding response OmpR family regulator
MIRPEERTIPRPPTLLIVDADHGPRTSLAALFRECGHSVAEAASGVEALRLARQRTPAVLVVDPWPFVSAAAQVVPQVRALRPTPAVLVVTSAPRSRTDVRSRFPEDVAWLERPCSPAELLAGVDRLLNRSAPFGSSAVGRPPGPLRPRAGNGHEPA